ncbi:uncharacterized protein LOC103709963 [Phoenix dactylifera]|uniref:Uncharacterized protein LOC103709963 n=1 Tax=Phoenix dactylifera TaxID=42345 RepID=A0A8B7C8A3_PHODC|nr:uncharacterized protein LOC103709963 [Phoenix dactylifera]
MQDQFHFPSCFTPGEPMADDPTSIAATKSGQSIVTSVYRTKIAGHCRLITVTWCKDVLVHGLSVSVEERSDSVDETNININTNQHMSCKVELRPWYFWRKHGSKRFHVEGKPVDVFWDLKSAKFSGEPEPQSNYYVAVVSDEEVVLLLGDLNTEAYRRTGSRPATIDATLVSRKEHVFGRRRFATRAKFSEKGKLHEILIECSSDGSGSSIGGNMDPEMVIKIDGHVAIHVRHLQWKFRGNQSVTVNKARVEVYWDVHDWIFSPGPRHALFIFKPSPLLRSSAPTSSSLSSFDGKNATVDGSSGFCLFLYACKLE